MMRQIAGEFAEYNRSAGLAGSGGKRQIWWNIAINRQALPPPPLSNPRPLEWLQTACSTGSLPRMGPAAFSLTRNIWAMMMSCSAFTRAWKRARRLAFTAAVKRPPIMTRFATALLALSAPAALAAEVQFVPLQDYIGQPGVEKDPAAISYVAQRCAALYAVFGKNLEDETDPERRKFMVEAHSAAEKFMGLAAREMMSGTTIQMKDAFARTAKTVVQLGDLYVDRIEAARNRAGNMFADPS